MRILTISGVTFMSKVALYLGVLECDVLRVGDPVVLVDAAGQRAPGVVAGVLVEDPTEGSRGARMIDEGKRGQALRVIVRSRGQSLEPASVVAIEQA